MWAGLEEHKYHTPDTARDIESRETQTVGFILYCAQGTWYGTVSEHTLTVSASAPVSGHMHSLSTMCLFLVAW